MNTAGPALAAWLDQAFAEILRDLRRQYLIGYYLHDLPRDTPKFHEVRIDLSRPELKVSARRGYYGE